VEGLSCYLDVKSFQQQLRWSCGPASLRTVLYYQYGLDLTDRELALLLGSNENGTSDFATGLKTLGFTYKQSSAGNLNKLKKELANHRLPIVHLVMSDGQGHYMVVVGYDDDNVYLSDPGTGKIIKYGIPFFLGVWKIEERETQTRWFIVVTGKSKHQIGSLIRKLQNVQRKMES
jgi:predicted double-glycine peptidase